MANNNVTPLEINQTKCILETIADKAAQLDQICFHYGCDDGPAAVELAIMLRDQIAQLGMLAATGVNKLGGWRDASMETWALPPVYPKEEADLAEFSARP